MKNKSFAMQYAKRELKQRRRAFLPVICIAFGVVLLMNSLMIFIESEYRSDLAYYKIETQLVMEALKSDEVERLRQLEYVKSVEAAENGGTYICFVQLHDEYCSDYGTYARTGVRVMEDMHLNNREPYLKYWRLYNEFGVASSYFHHCGLFNEYYMRALANNPMTSGSMFLVIFLSFLMHLASMTLVFGMKIRRSKQEYAAMRGMGAPMRILRRINQIEAVGITLVTYVPAILISLVGMYAVCRLSEFIYTDYKLNSVLHFHVPWPGVGLALLSYILAAYLAIFLCTKSMKKRSVTELTKGTDTKTPYVAKTSVKYVSSPDFSLYGRTESRRNGKNLLPTRGLFAALTAFPIMITTMCVGAFLSTGKSPSEYLYEGTLTYTFSSDVKSIDSWSVTKSLAELMLSLDGVTAVEDYREMGLNPFGNDDVRNLPKEYNGASLHEDFQYRSALFGDEDVPARGTCIAPSEYFSVGDTVEFTLDGKPYPLTVSSISDDGIRTVKINNYTYYEAVFTVSDETIADIMGWDEPRYSRLNIYCAEGREEELVNRIDTVALMSGDYINDYDRQIHQLKLFEYTGSAVFLERRITDIRDAFLILFLLTEAGYLLICAGAVIYSVTAYDVDGRKREFAILRALGLDGESLRSMAGRRQVVGIVVMSVISYIGLTLLCGIADESIRIYKVPGTNQWVFEGMDTLLNYVVFIGITCVLALVGYGICAWLAAVRTVDDVVREPIAENVKYTD